MKHISFILLLAPLLLLGACTTVYMPPPAHAPFITEPGKTSISAGVSSSGVIGHGAWSPAENVMLLSSGVATLPVADTMASHVYGDAAIGVYLMGSKTFRLEAFAGAGIGHGRAMGADIDLPHDQRNELHDLKLTYARYFAQLNIGTTKIPAFRGILPEERVQTALALRVAWLDVLSNSIDGRKRTPVDAPLYEAFWIMRSGWPSFNIETQIGLSFHTKGAEGIGFAMQPFIFAVSGKVLL